MSIAAHITCHGARINLGDLPPYFTYGSPLFSFFVHLPVFSVSETARDSVAVFQSVISRYVVPMLKLGCWESLKIQSVSVHGSSSRQISEPEFVNVSGAQESIPPAYVAWLAGTITLFVIPARQLQRLIFLESIPDQFGLW